MNSLRGAVIALILLTALPSLAVLVTMAVQSRAEAMAEAEAAARRLLEVAAVKHLEAIDGTRRLLHFLARQPELHPRGDTAACERRLADIAALYPHFNNLGLADRDGALLCSSLPLPGAMSIADRSYFQRALASRGFAAGDYQIGRLSGKSGINYALPISGPDGEPEGVVYAGVGLHWLNELVAGTKLLPGVAVALLDSHDTVLAHYPDPARWIGQRHDAVAGGARREVLLLSRDLHEGPDGAVRLLIAIPHEDIYAGINQRFSQSLLFLALVMLSALLLAWLGGRTLILQRVNTLVAAARRIGAGQLGARSGMAHSADEVGQLAQTFDAMAQDLERRDQELGRAHRALRTLSAANRALLRAGDEQALLREMCRVVVGAGSYPAAWVGSLEGESARLRPVATAGEAEHFLRTVESFDNGYVRSALLRGEALVLRPETATACCPEWGRAMRRAGYASLLLLPLRVDAATVAALIVHAREADAFDAVEQDLLAETAQDLAFGIRSLRMQQRQQEAEATVRHLARYEPLTGLPNRMSFHERLAGVLAEGQATPPRPVAVMLLDLDRFREINTAVGYDQGDQVLREVGARLSSVLPEGAFLAHVGEDEFGLLLPGMDGDQAAETAKSLLRLLEQPLDFESLSVAVTASIGIALFPDHGSDPDELFRRADAAMHGAKQARLGHLFYTPDRDQATPRRLILAVALRRAIENGDLSLVYQPKVHVAARAVCGAEALARWQHAELGPISPLEFITLAEHTGMIKPLTEWVVAEAARQSSAWAAEGTPLTLAVNLSSLNLQEPNLVEKVAAALDGAGASPAGLAIELTESALMIDPDGALHKLRQLHEMGLTLFIDDYGTGYSSLRYLQKLPVDAIKIDQSFVQHMLEHKDSRQIVRSTIELAHGLGLGVVAEGVENEATLQALAELRCDVVQGYGISRPLPAEQVPGWIAACGWTLRSGAKRAGLWRPS